MRRFPITTVPPLAALSILCFMLWGGSALSNCFVSLYFKENGLAELQIGTIVSTASLTTMFFGFLWGWLADRFSIYLQLLAGASFGFVVINLAYPHTHLFAGFLALLIAMQAISKIFSVTFPVMALPHLPSASPGKAYGRFRLWGSLGFFLFPLFGGWIAQRWRLTAVFYAAAVFFAVCILAEYAILPRAPARHPAAVRAARPGLATPALVLLFACELIVSIWGPASFSFLSIYARQLGASYALVGLLSASNGILAMAGMLLFGPLLDRMRIPRLLTASYLLIALRLLLISWAPGPGWLLLAQTVHVFHFPVRELGVIFYIREHAPEESRARALGFWSVMVTIGETLGAVAAGYLIEHAGYVTMYRAIAAFPLAAAAAMTLGLFRLRKRAAPAMVPETGN